MTFYEVFTYSVVFVGGEGGIIPSHCLQTPSPPTGPLYAYQGGNFMLRKTLLLFFCMILFF